jgi:rubrerythrin
MTMPQDELRREAREIQQEHEASLSPMRDALACIFGEGSPLSTKDKSGLLLGGLNRRGLFKIGGITVASAAVLAACGDDGDTSGAAATTAASGTTAAPGSAGTTAASGVSMSSDIVILRTASSIEELAVAAYQTAIDSGLVTTAAVGDAAKLFQAQHKEHSGLFQGATTAAGGEPFAEANPALLDALKPTIDGLKDEMGIIAFALELEQVAAQTYQSNVGTFADPTLNVAIMSVGGVEARHAAVLASVLGAMPGSDNLFPTAFQSTMKAVMAGTGV